MNIGFHIFTIGIPWAFYQIGSWYFSKSINVINLNNNDKLIEKTERITQSTIQSTSGKQTGTIDQRVAYASGSRPAKPYSIYGNQAMDFARKKLSEYSNSVSETRKDLPSLSRDITRLKSIYFELNKTFNKTFNDVFLKYKNDSPWTNEEVMAAADECMKIAFAISNLTLDNLEAKLLNTDIERTQNNIQEAFGRNLIKEYHQSQYENIQNFYFCTVFYHRLRGENCLIKPGFGNPIVPNIDRNTIWNYDRSYLKNVYYKDVSEPYSALFYEKGTIQNSWNDLYNEFCDRLKFYIEAGDLSLLTYPDKPKDRVDGSFIHRIYNESSFNS